MLKKPAIIDYGLRRGYFIAEPSTDPLQRASGPNPLLSAETVGQALACRSLPRRREGPPFALLARAARYEFWLSAFLLMADSFFFNSHSTRPPVPDDTLVSQKMIR